MRKRRERWATFLLILGAALLFLAGYVSHA